MTQEIGKMCGKACVEERNDAPIPDRPSSHGILIPLKTTLETRARESLVSVFVTTVPVKQASGTLE